MFKLINIYTYPFVCLKKKNNFNFIYFFKYVVFINQITSLKKINYVLLKHQSKNFFNQITKLSYFYFRTINYVGKTYKIIEKKKILNMKFNRSHVTYLFFTPNIILKKVAKFKFKFKFFLAKNIKQLKLLFSLIRKQNIFTSRGIKYSKNIKYKKKGKISTYTF